MARRAQPAKRKKAAPKKSTRKKSAPKKKSGGIGRLMLGGAFVAGTLSAIIAVGSMLELDRASDEFGRAVDQKAPDYTLAEPAPTPKLRKDYKLSEDTPTRGRTGYLVGNEEETEGAAPETAAVPKPRGNKPEPDILPGDSGSDHGVAPDSDRNAPWRKYAALTPNAGNAPVIAIVIDDAGLDQPRTARTVLLPGPVTISYLPYARDLQPQVNAARKAGHEVMLHMPMEPSSASVDPGPHALLAKYDRQKILNEMTWMLDQFDLDSRTSAKSVGFSTANEFGVPAITRDVFIDDADDDAKIADMLARIERVAAKQGYAIAIGHPRDRTLKALQNWIPSLKAKGFVLVPATEVLRRTTQSATG